MSFVARAGLIKSRGSMGRVPALRAESVFYFIRQEKRKRRDAIAKLEYKSFYFYSEAMKHMKKVDGDDDLPLSDLQYWDSFDYDTEIIEKQFLHSMSVKVRHRSGKITEGGKYVFTIDSCHRDLDRVDLSYSETPEEHKSHNCIILPNGQFGLYPNNRCQWFDESLTPSEVKKPDFLVSTRRFSVENGGPNGRLGDSEEYFWETPEEKDANRLKKQRWRARPKGKELQRMQKERYYERTKHLRKFPRSDKEPAKRIRIEASSQDIDREQPSKPI